MKDILTKEFTLAEVLGVISGYLLADKGFDRLHELMEWLAGQSVFTHQIPYIAEDVKKALVKQFPQFNMEDDSELARDVKWLVAAMKEKNEVSQGAIWRRLKIRYGSMFQVAPMQSFDDFEMPPLITPNIAGKFMTVDLPSDEFPANLEEK